MVVIFHEKRLSYLNKKKKNLAVSLWNFLSRRSLSYNFVIHERLLHQIKNHLPFPIQCYRGQIYWRECPSHSGDVQLCPRPSALHYFHGRNWRNRWTAVFRGDIRGSRNPADPHGAAESDGWLRFLGTGEGTRGSFYYVFENKLAVLPYFETVWNGEKNPFPDAPSTTILCPV